MINITRIYIVLALSLLGSLFVAGDSPTTDEMSLARHMSKKGSLLISQTPPKPEGWREKLRCAVPGRCSGGRAIAGSLISFVPELALLVKNVDAVGSRKNLRLQLVRMFGSSFALGLGLHALGQICQYREPRPITLLWKEAASLEKDVILSLRALQQKPEADRSYLTLKAGDTLKRLCLLYGELLHKEKQIQNALQKSPKYDAEKHLQALEILLKKTASWLDCFASSAGFCVPTPKELELQNQGPSALRQITTGWVPFGRIGCLAGMISALSIVFDLIEGCKCSQEGNSGFLGSGKCVRKAGFSVIAAMHLVELLLRIKDQKELSKNLWMKNAAARIVQTLLVENQGKKLAEQK